MILGIFAGYHIGEYGQTNNCAFSKCVRGTQGDGSGGFADTPLAACLSDFIFFDFF
jgi:hypothetical protein